jgi:hypothetical protein
MELAPEHADTYCVRAVTLNLSGHREQAITDALKCVELADDPVLRHEAETLLKELEQ